MVYHGGTDGGGTEIHHNWFHGNRAKACASGLYLDNYTHNFLLHHNVIWDCPGLGLQLNRPSGYNLVVHNTVLGKVSHWGRWPGQEVDGMFGDMVVNNLVSDVLEVQAEVFAANNLSDLADAVPPPSERLVIPDACVDRGAALTGLDGGFVGTGPDIGAYEAGGDAWRPGHDFAKAPDVHYRLTRTPYANLLRNACFEFCGHLYGGQDDGSIAPWTATHAKSAKAVFSGGFEESPETRNSRFGFSLVLSADAEDGVEQTADGLLPGKRYEFAVFVKSSAAVTPVCLSVTQGGGHDATAGYYFASISWKRLAMEFTAGAPIVTVCVTKNGANTVYVDDTGLALNLAAPPRPNAGPDQSLDPGVTTAELVGALPVEASPTVGMATEWCCIAGPGTVAFSAPLALESEARFETPGRYTLALVTRRGDFAGYDSLVVHMPDPRSRATTLTPIVTVVTRDGVVSQVPPLLCGNPAGVVGGDRRAFLVFDLRLLDDLPVTRARLRIFIRKGPGESDRYGSCTLWHVAAVREAVPGWDAPLAAEPMARVSVPGDPRDCWFETEVTGMVREAQGKGCVVFALRGTEGFTGTARFFDAPGEANRPTLTVLQEP